MEHIGDLRGVQVPGELQEEHVLPAVLGQGAGFQLHHVQAVDGEDGENLMEGARLMGEEKDGADLVSALPQLHLGRDHHKTGGVVGVVVGGTDQDVQPVDLGGPGRAQGGFCQVAALGHHLGRPGGVRLGHGPPVGVLA